jgi:hypothetical protein
VTTSCCVGQGRVVRSFRLHSGFCTQVKYMKTVNETHTAQRMHDALQRLLATAACYCAVRLPQQQPLPPQQRHWPQLQHPGLLCVLQLPPPAAAVHPVALPVAAHPTDTGVRPQQMVCMRKQLGLVCRMHPHSVGYAKVAGCIIGADCSSGKAYIAAAAQDLQVYEQVADVRGINATDAAGLPHVPRPHLSA